MAEFGRNSESFFGGPFWVIFGPFYVIWGHLGSLFGPLGSFWILTLHLVTAGGCFFSFLSQMSHSRCFQRQFQTSPQASEVRRTMYFARFWEKTCITIRVLYNRINVLSLDKTRFLPRNQLTGLTGVEKTRSLIQHCKADFKTS